MKLSKLFRKDIPKLSKEVDSELLDRINKIKVETKPMKRKEFLESAHNIFREPAFQEVLNDLVERQIEHSIRMTKNWEQVMFDRATLNGFDLVKEEFGMLEGEFQNTIKPAEQFNKHDIL